MSTNTLLKRITIFITIAVFTLTYTCSVFAYDDIGNPDVDLNDPAVQEQIQAVAPLPAPTVTAFLTSSGVNIYWTEITGADGYKLFRREAGTMEWQELSTEKKSTLRTADKKLTNGKQYTYAVCAYQKIKVTLPADEPTTPDVPSYPETEQPSETQIDPGNIDSVTPEDPEQPTEPEQPETPEQPTEPEAPEEPAPPITATVTVDGTLAETGSVFWLTPSSVTKAKKSGTKMSVTWTKNPYAAGYQVEYSKNRFFEGSTTLTINGASSTSLTLSKLRSASNYYVRVRGYAVFNDVTQYAPWALSSNAKATKTAKTTKLTYKKKNVGFELRGRAGYKVGSYDTLQGACTDGTYSYNVLYNRKTQKCRIIKVKMSTMKVVKKSGAMKIYHGNDLTYNPDTGRLVVLYGQPYYKNIAVINPKTLKINSRITLSLPKQLPGLSEKDRKAFEGITAMAYNTTHDLYVARMKTQGHLLLFDKHFTPVRYIHLNKKGGQTYQGMDTTDDYILVGQSFASGKPYNIITVYDWTGNYLSTVRVRKGYELENVYHANGTFYSGFYRSGYKTKYVTKYKTKKVKGKKKRVKVKVKKKTLFRSNYIYKVTGL